MEMLQRNFFLIDFAIGAAIPLSGVKMGNIDQSTEETDLIDSK